LASVKRFCHKAQQTLCSPCRKPNRADI
jgi:hypothetical protein